MKIIVFNNTMKYRYLRKYYEKTTKKLRKNYGCTTMIYRSQAKWCELMAVRAPTVKREWGQKTSTVHSHPQPRLRHSHEPTSPAIHDFLAGGKGDSRLWQGKAGAIHNLDPSIHNLVHNFWQGKGSNGDLCSEIAILMVLSSPYQAQH